MLLTYERVRHNALTGNFAIISIAVTLKLATCFVPLWAIIMTCW